MIMEVDIRRVYTAVIRRRPVVDSIPEKDALLFGPWHESIVVARRVWMPVSKLGGWLV